MKKNAMIIQISLALVFGILVGTFLPMSGPLLKPIGEVFLRLMQMTIPILILGQIVQALGSIDLKELASIGTRTLLIFGISSLLAALWGVLLAVLFAPGTGMEQTDRLSPIIEVQELSLQETFLQFVPDNIFDSLTQGSIIQIIVFAIFFGLALNHYTQKQPESQLFQLIIDFNEVIIKVINYVMRLAPIGIFALVSSSISQLGTQVILPMVKYLLVYTLATLLFLLVWLIIVSIYGRLHPLKLIINMKNISIMALATTSSAITLPIELEESQYKLGLSKRISHLVLPLGMSLNSNGSAMHMALTVITIAQMYQIDFKWTTMIYLAIMATFISLANAVVPGAGLVSLAIIVPQMGLPIESIAIFGGVEWLVGMLRTILNVNSDVYSAILVAKSVDEIDYEVFEQT
ncbi:dicarboxylate/amino acid:cation symporter [Candidatus Enterococcus mangumiae]|uniref:Sodium:dicarboxylate symporter family protein n=1 Tax=Candidatus Enterococcus mangumiae TaxID=2230878 RepID=A0ABZ2SW51_9ENTE|nr:dicarboxylate/amino acid:cation symporter [Enterococcus sp. DIV1094]MBO0490256.1 dicarboxylate/amino acid:cation symporter [Enterococcus sp. DIV1094]